MASNSTFPGANSSPGFQAAPLPIVTSDITPGATSPAFSMALPNGPSSPIAAPVVASQAPPGVEYSQVPTVRSMGHHLNGQQKHVATHPSTTRQSRPADARVAKPAIMDPPGSHIPSAQLQQSGFPSPKIDHAQLNDKFVHDVSRLTYAIHQSLPEATRRVVRDNWERCLLGTEFHQAFVTNASIHRASEGAVQRSIRDFGAKMVLFAREDILKHFSQQDLDEVAHLILPKASNRFLDMALEARLRTIEAKPLINALAKAERLGYEPGDVVEEDEQHGQERVIPNMPQPPQHLQQFHIHPHQLGGNMPVPTQPVMTPKTAIQGQLNGSRPQCSLCFRIFEAQSAHDHHVKKMVCTRTPSGSNGFKLSCAHCGQGFTTGPGLQYHNRNGVCGHFGEVNTGVAAHAAQPAQPLPARPASVPPGAIRAAPPTPPPPPVDPYAHVTPEQMVAMTAELRRAEVQYGEKLRIATKQIADPGERRVRLEGLRNSFNTKQSNVRKKYGVRLRERRSKAELEAQKGRIDTATSVPSSSPMSAPQPLPWTHGATTVGSTAPPSAQGYHAAPDAKRRRLDDGSTAAAASASSGAGTPLRHKIVSVDIDMGGGVRDTSGSATQIPAPHTYTQAGARVQIHAPEGEARHPAAVAAGVGGSGERPISLSDSEGRDEDGGGDGGDGEAAEDTEDGEGGDGVEDGDDDDGESSDDEDIPAVLPGLGVQ